ncbi:hypothetical protein KC717_04805 [Candidatus Dojkabacteria bacterium]|uniref:Uncharacterized protein n=1 Tax=Candidatus Dojkabacteria bacterium TaxID=2099670 RepID=A0A955L8F3_9BACT|nr:hypothetical protein [Candidatus Dojkabacteria bacterium]
MNYFTYIVLGLLVSIIGIFLIRSKLIRVMSFGIRVTFIGLILTTIVSLFGSDLFTQLADASLKKSGVHEVIQEVDSTLRFDFVKDSAEDIWDDLKGLFGGDEEVEQAEEIVINEEGVLETRLYPLLVNMIGNLYQYTTLILSLLGLILLTYISYATQSVQEAVKLDHKVNALEKRLRVLEHRG